SVRGKEGILTDFIPILKRRFNGPKLTQIPTNHDTVFLPEPFSRNGRCRYANGRLTGRGSPPATMVTNPILLPIGVVCVPGAKGIDQIAVIPAPGIFVSNEQRNRGAGGPALK